MVTRVAREMMADLDAEFTALEEAIGNLETDVSGKQNDLGLTGLADDVAIRSGSSETEALTPGSVFDAAVVVALTDAVTIAVDLSAGFNFSVVLGGDREFGSPANAKQGQCGVIEIYQDATGSRLLYFGSGWVFAGGEAPELSTDPNACDLLSYFVLSNGVVYASLIKDVK